MRTPSAYSVFAALSFAMAACSAAPPGASPQDGTGEPEGVATTSQASIVSCNTGESLRCERLGLQEECGCRPNTTWTLLAHSPGGPAYGLWLMQDGTVLAQGGPAIQDLERLTPDATGSYVNGTWSSAGSMLVEKLYYASQVLSSGILVSCGGEYSGANLPKTETGDCEYYTPNLQFSYSLAEPPGWGAIGDSPSEILPDGTMLMGNTQGIGQQAAVLDPVTMGWSIVGGDSDNEEGYVLMQTGDVLTADVYNQGSERYSMSAQAFVEDGPVPVVLGANSEIGPGLSLMDGRVIWFGASGQTAIYTPTASGQNGSWVAGPALPVVDGDQMVASDVPALLEPNGRVLVAIQGAKTAPTQFVEYDPPSNTFQLVGSYGPSSFPNVWDTRTLLLPNGHALVSLDNGDWYDVAFLTGPQAQWAPTITSFPSKILTTSTGTTVTLSGTQLCGLSDVSTFGDDNQQSENYPTVRIVSSTGVVTYVPATGVSTRSIAPNEAGTVQVALPGSLPLGTYSLNVVAMGIPSNTMTFDLTEMKISHFPPPAL